MHTLTRAADLPLGLMFNPDSGYAGVLTHYTAWAAENGCFAKGAAFDAPGWLAWLDTLPRDRCLFAVCPDVWADGLATVARAVPLAGAVRALGYRAAIVAQAGITVATYPWAAADALFVGGPDDWQQSDTVQALVTAARQRGLWCHRGRVNGLGRLQSAQVQGYDSADGTYLRFGPDANWPTVRRWLRVTSQQQPLFVLGGQVREEVWRVIP